MNTLNFFMSIVLIAPESTNELKTAVQAAEDAIINKTQDYEIIIVDRHVSPVRLELFRNWTSYDGMQNIQVFALLGWVEDDEAAWIGVENALGDFVAVVDPEFDSPAFLTQMLKSVSENEVVYAKNFDYPSGGFAYRLATKVFDQFFFHFRGVRLIEQAPKFRILSKRVINFILQHSMPQIAYRHFPLTGGFKAVVLEYHSGFRSGRHKSFFKAVARGARILFTATNTPMRVASFLCLFGALSNLLYSMYVVFVHFFFDQISPGWTSLSLQQSGMFFLISLVLLILSEYVVNITLQNHNGFSYFVGHEFTSSRLGRREKLNVDYQVGKQELSLDSLKTAIKTRPYR